MNNSSTSHNVSHPDWQVLGELELRVGSNTNDTIRAWLSEVLYPLRLHAHFLDQLLQSAQDAAERAMRLERAVEFRHLQFLVHAPKQSASHEQTWGFFQIEKMGDSAKSGNPQDHAIEFYLYLEG